MRRNFETLQLTNVVLKFWWIAESDTWPQFHYTAQPFKIGFWEAKTSVPFGLKPVHSHWKITAKRQFDIIVCAGAYVSYVGTNVKLD